MIKYIFKFYESLHDTKNITGTATFENHAEYYNILIGHGFLQLDSGMIINMNKVAKYEIIKQVVATEPEVEPEDVAPVLETPSEPQNDPSEPSQDEVEEDTPDDY